MAMAQPFWIRKRRMLILFVGPMLLVRCTKTALTTHSNTNTSALEKHGYYGSRSIDINWTVKRLCKRGRLKEALDVLHAMNQHCSRVDSSTYASLLQACVNRKALREGKLVHSHMIDNGFNPDIFSGNNLVIMYAKCGSVVDARRVLEEMPKRNVVSWTAMIAAYVSRGHDEEALTLFYQMQRTGIQPNQFTFASVLPACANLAALEHGKKVHEDVTRSGFQSDVFVSSALVDMYAKCGCIEDARKVFNKMPERNVVSWNSMIAGYAQNGHIDEALKFFQRMDERDLVSWNAMIAGFARNGHVDEALALFQKMPEQNEVSWNTMIAGFANNEQFDEALDLFRQMQLTGGKPDSVTYISILPTCANLAAIKNGKEVHENILRRGFQFDIFVGSALIDMYAKCGYIEDACKVFDEMPERDMVSWTAMIVGYAIHGCGKEALQLFEQMQHSGVKPDRVTFLGVLSACCHAGLVDDGCQYFVLMNRDYHLTPAVEHYCCVVDLLGRAGRLNEAQEFISKMPIKPNAVIWGSLLAACRIHTNTGLGERVAELLLELEPENAARYVLLSNIYAAAGRWDDVQKVRKLMKDRRVQKSPGCSWIEVNSKVHSFLVRDTSHPQTHKI